jgi:hypothetical protein
VTMSTTYAERRAERLSKPCPRCKAPTGVVCTTPNGWLTHHKVREQAVAGETVKAPKLGRLSDAQAQRIEHAAEHGTVWVPHRANFGGDRAQITVVEKLAKKGLLVQVGDDGTERTFALTVAGWKVYREHRLIIRRLSDEDMAAGEAAATELESNRG